MFHRFGEEGPDDLEIREWVQRLREIIEQGRFHSLDTGLLSGSKTSRLNGTTTGDRSARVHCSGCSSDASNLECGNTGCGVPGSRF